MLPAYVGLLVAVAVGGSRPQYLAAFAIGVFLWFFSDTIGGSSYLAVNEGLSGGLSHLTLVILFGVALVAFFLVEGGTTRHGGADTPPRSQPLVIPVLVAVALSIHGMGEGVDFGNLASSTSSTSIIGAFGGYAPAASYMAHKVLEPVAIGACYSSFSVFGRGLSSRSISHWKGLVLVGTIFGIPTLIGAAAGYYFPFDTTYLFALGAGASVYVLFKIVQVLFERSNPLRSFGESMRIALFSLLGFVLIYVAALFHSVA